MKLSTHPSISGITSETIAIATALYAFMSWAWAAFIYRLGHVMAQAVNRRHFTAYSWVRSHPSPCRTYVDQSDAGRGFSPNTLVIPVHIIPPTLHFRSSSTDAISYWPLKHTHTHTHTSSLSSA